jgi:hypothetical protein
MSSFIVTDTNNLVLVSNQRGSAVHIYTHTYVGCREHDQFKPWQRTWIVLTFLTTMGHSHWPFIILVFKFIPLYFQWFGRRYYVPSPLLSFWRVTFLALYLYIKATSFPISLQVHPKWHFLPTYNHAWCKPSLDQQLPWKPTTPQYGWCEFTD